MGRFSGKAALVTGAASGLGQAIARRLAREGAQVVVADLDLAGARRVALEITSTGGAASPIEVDVSDEDRVRHMVGAALDRLERVDALFNTAAVTSGPAFLRDQDLIDLDVAVWDRVLAVNLRGVMLGCKHAIPTMVACGGGAIVNISSTAAHQGTSGRAAYGASKAGVESLTRSVATMYGQQKIRCNAVAPGYMANPHTAAREPAGQAAMAGFERLLPEAASPDDVAALCAFLGSAEAAAITGQTCVADSGRLAQTVVLGEPRARHRYRGARRSRKAATPSRPSAPSAQAAMAAASASS